MTWRPSLVARAAKLFDGNPLPCNEPDAVETLRQMVAALEGRGQVPPELRLKAKQVVRDADVAAADNRRASALVIPMEKRRG